jgi:tetratricopeptide (TPR) repeat protein
MDNDHDHLTTAGERPQSTGTVDHPSHPDDSGPIEPPVVGDRYHIVTLHRSGGLGRVWVARDAALGRDVALKDLRPVRARDPRLRARFVEEARITGQLEHPSIVPLYDLIDGPDGPCYTMRFVAGRTLAEAAREYHDRRSAGRATRLDLAGLLDAFVAVCQAVAFAHSRGVLHRDLKGQNVVLGGYGEVFVLDWGLAKLAAGPEMSLPGALRTAGPAGVTPTPVGPRDETVTGAILGTPAFLAPEQAAGDPASTASDVYGLGAMLYVILTGAPPYDGPNMQDVLDRVLAGPPPPPRTINPACPAGLEAICIKAMARDPAARYLAAAAVAADVRRWLADEPVEAYREPWAARAARWARRHRPAVIGVVAVLLTAVVGLAVSTTLIWQEERRTAEQKDHAEREWARAEDNLNIAGGLAFDMLGISEDRRNGLPQISQTVPARRAMTAAALNTYRQALAQRPEDPKLQQRTAQAYRYSANLHRTLNETAAAEQPYRESVRMFEHLVGQCPDEPAFRDLLAETLRDQAQLMNRLGRVGDAVAGGRRAAGLAEELLAADPGRPEYRRTLAVGLIDLSGYEHTRARFAESEEAARRAADLLGVLIEAPGKSSSQENRLFLVMALHRRAIALGELDRVDESLAASGDALAQLQRLPDGDNNVQHFRGRTFVEQAKVLVSFPGRREEAERDVGRAIVLWDDLQKLVPRTVVYREWQAAAFEVRGRIRAALDRRDLAAEDLEKSRTMLEKLVSEFPDLPAYRSLLGADVPYARPAGSDWRERTAGRGLVGKIPRCLPGHHRSGARERR